MGLRWIQWGKISLNAPDPRVYHHNPCTLCATPLSALDPRRSSIPERHRTKAMLRAALHVVAGETAARSAASGRWALAARPGKSMEKGLGRRSMMAPKVKKGRSGKALDPKTVNLLKLLDAQPTKR